MKRKLAFEFNLVTKKKEKKIKCGKNYDLNTRNWVQINFFFKF